MLAWIRMAFAFVIAICSIRTECSLAQDWASALGSDRNCKSVVQLPNNWSVDQISLSWELDAGEGFAGPIVVDGNAYLWDRVDAQLRLRSVKLADGKVNWTCLRPAIYSGGMDPDKGPRATPTYFDGRVYAWSAGGILLCVSADDGEVVWEKNLAKEMPGGEGYFGYGGGPIIMGETVIINVGGRRAAVVGLNRISGEIAWTAGEDQASYATPISCNIDGNDFALLISRLHFLVINPSDGKIVAETEFGKRGATVSAASPVMLDNNQVFLNAAYGIGAKVVQLPKTIVSEEDKSEKLNVIWEDEKSFASQYTTPVFVDGYLYGTTGREDFNDAQFRCVRASDGKVMWTEPNWSLAHGILVGKKLLLLSLDNRLIVVSPNPERFQQLGEKKLGEASCRPLPAIADECLVFRTIVSSTERNPKWICIKLK